MTMNRRARLWRRHSKGRARTSQPAASAAEAEQLLLRCAPALIIADLGMPVEDGFWLIRDIRQRLASDVPAIALSAYAGNRNRPPGALQPDSTRSSPSLRARRLWCNSSSLCWTTAEHATSDHTAAGNGVMKKTMVLARAVALLPCAASAQTADNAADDGLRTRTGHELKRGRRPLHVTPSRARWRYQFTAPRSVRNIQAR